MTDTHNTLITVGLVGYGKAGCAVAQVVHADPRFDLGWIAKRTTTVGTQTLDGCDIAVAGLDEVNFSDWLDRHPVGAMVDFSAPQSLMVYGEELRRRKIMLISAISADDEKQLSYARSLGQDTRVL